MKAQDLYSVHNIRNYGATGNGEHLDTKAIQKAIDVCHGNQGGTVLFPPGRYLAGTLYLKSNVTLHLDAQAVLLGSRRIEDYASDTDCCRYVGESNKDRCLLYAENAERIRLEGSGTIDGQGRGIAGKRPMMMRFLNCRDVRVRDLAFRDGAAWCASFVLCDDIWVDSVTIHNRANHNGDGLDLDGCENVFISNCKLSCGDDCIALQTSEEKPCRNIVITNCVLSSDWAAIRFGPLSCGNFEDITMSNCVIHDTWGCGIKLQMNEGACIENVLFSNLVMRHVTGPISLCLSDCVTRRDRPDQSPRPIRTFRNIQFSNVRAQVVVAPPFERFPGERLSCISITGKTGHPIEGVSFTDVHITYAGGGSREHAGRRNVPELDFETTPEYFRFGILPAYGLYARHVRDLTLNNVSFDLENPDLRPAIVCDDVQDLEIAGLSARGNAEAESLLRLQQTRRAFIHGCHPTADTRVFVLVEGDASREIAVVDNDLRGVRTPAKIAHKAQPGALLVRNNVE